MRQAGLRVIPLLLVMAGCGTGDSPTEPREARISFVSGANVTDTIGAEPAATLRVRVRGIDGKPAAATEVRANAVPNGTGLSTVPEILAGFSAGGPHGLSAVSMTDENGIAEFRVKLGTKAGPGRLAVSVPSLGVMDTARFTVTPGALAAVESLPADTAIRIGGSAKVTAFALDRGGNRRSGTDPIVLVASGTGGSLADGIVSGSSFGRMAVVATVAGRSDTSYVSVVPQGTIAAYSLISSSADMASVYTFDTDGSNFRELRQTIRGRGFITEMPVAWLGGSKLVYEDMTTDYRQQLYVLNLATGGSERLLSAADQMEEENYPRVSRDGGWVYFSGGGTSPGWGIFRVRPDGSGRERLTPSNRRLHLPTPSPDGREVAYIADAGIPTAEGDLVVLTLATGQVRKLATHASMPRWSPDGTQIAYLARLGQVLTAPGYGELSVIRPDGTGERVVPRSKQLFRLDLDWSPDGRFIVGTQGGRTTLVEVATGIEVPLTLPRPGDASIVSPVWKP